MAMITGLEQQRTQLAMDLHDEMGSGLTAAVARTVLALLGTTTDTAAAVDTRRARLDAFQLTDRERDVLQCLVRRMAYNQVGDTLGISIDTVRTHIRGVYRKLQVHSVADPVGRVLQEG